MSVLVKSIPATHHENLARIHPFLLQNKSVVVAGGCARDIVLGDQPFKDIDVFVPCDDIEELIANVAKVTLFCSNNSISMQQISGSYAEIGAECDLRVIGLIKAGGLDFVFMPKFRNPMTLVDAFDTVVNQAWLQVTEKGFDVMTTKLFQELHNRKILGIFPAKTGDRTGHAERMLERFPDFLPLELATPEPKNRNSKPRGSKAYEGEVPF